jgi:hypothetical protein
MRRGEFGFGSWLLASMLALSFAPSLARADASANPGTVSPANKTSSQSDPIGRARALFGAGVQAARKGDWTTAEAAFAAAFELKRHWQIAANLGDSELALGRYRQAAEHLAFAVRGAPADLGETERKRQQEHWQEAKAHVGSVRVESGDGQPFELFVDGEPIDVETAREEIYVDPGPHRVEAHGEKGPLATQQIQAEAGTVTTVRLRIASPAASNGEPAVAPPSAAVPSVAAEPADAPEPNATKPRPIWPAAVGAVVALGAAAAGTGFLIAAHHQRNAAAAAPSSAFPDPSCKILGTTSGTAIGSSCGDLKADLEAHDRYNNLGTAAFGLAGVAAATVIYWFATAPAATASAGAAPPAPRMKPAAAVTPDRITFSLSGNF